MRILFIFIFLRSFIGFNQNEHPDIRIPLKWDDFEAPLSPEEKKEEIKKIRKSKYWIKWDDDEIDEHLNNCHFIDVDDDSLPDIVYNGRHPIGIETDNIAIFKNTGKAYELVSKFNGQIRKMSRLNGRKRPIRFVILTSPCCDHIYHRMRYFYFDNEINYTPQDSVKSKPDKRYAEYNGEDGVKMFREFSYVMNLHFPEGVGSKVLRTFRDTTFLMRKPSVMEGTFLESEDRHAAMIDSTSNKAVAMVLPNQKCIGIGYEITDGIPYFLIMIENAKLTSNYMSTTSGMQLGWVDGRHVIGNSFRDVNDD